MSFLHTLPKVVARRKRVGRGTGSGHGVTATRGTKGQKARAGWRHRAGFEGGQTPLYMRLPKGRGSKQRFAPQTVRYTAITIGQLTVCARVIAGEVIGPGQLRAFGIVRYTRERVKLIGTGTFSKKMTVRVHAVTSAARQAIEAAGGKVELIT